MAALERLLQQLDATSEPGWPDDTYDLADCSSLSDEEKAIFADKLLAAVQAGDGRALLTLGYIGAPGASYQKVVDLAFGTELLSPVARRAMVKLGKADSIVDKIADDARGSPSSDTRYMAVVMLPEVGGPAAKAALLDALSDPTDSIRMKAWEGLIALYDLKAAISDPDGVRQLQTYVELWHSCLLCDEKSFIDLGADEMRWVARYLDAGTPLADLSIAWTPKTAEDVIDAFRDCLFDADKPLPVAGMKALTGFNRRACEQLVAFRLEDFDPRAVPALVELAAAWTVPILDEQSKNEDCPPDVSEAMAAARETLRPQFAGRYIYVRDSSSSTLEQFQRALADAMCSPTAIVFGHESGNPRDGFWRETTITAYRPPGHIAGPPLRIELTLGQDLYYADKPATDLRSIHVRGDDKAPEVAAFLDAVVKIGCTLA